MQYRVYTCVEYIFMYAFYHEVIVRIPKCISLRTDLQYYLYCSRIPMLQTGIGFVALRVGHKKCSTVNCAYLAQAARRRLALDELYQQTRHDFSLLISIM